MKIIQKVHNRKIDKTNKKVVNTLEKWNKIDKKIRQVKKK